MAEYDRNWLRAFAADCRREHDPANQVGNRYERCALCHYTRHPCDVYDLADGMLWLLNQEGSPDKPLRSDVLDGHAGTTTEHEVASEADAGQPTDASQQADVQGEPAEAGEASSPLTACCHRWHASRVEVDTAPVEHVCTGPTDHGSRHRCSCGATVDV